MDVLISLFVNTCLRVSTVTALFMNEFSFTPVLEGLRNCLFPNLITSFEGKLELFKIQRVLFLFLGSGEEKE